MNRSGKTVYHFIVVSLVISLLTACAPVALTEAPAPPVEQNEVPPETPTLEDVPLTPAQFDGNLTSNAVGNAPVLVGTGTLVNDFGQVLLITVTGTSETSVLEYFATARFYFAVTDTFEFSADTEPQEELPDLSTEELFSDTAAENLTIEFQLSEETAKEYPKGVVYLVVDPTVKQYQYNNYGTRDPWSDYVKVTVQTSTGRVTARLYRQCVYRTGASVPAPYATPISNTGAGKFDLAVQGINTGSNTYRLTGAWSFDYLTEVASVASPNITCL